MYARQVSKEWHKLPMQVCFKPDRLSAIPLNLLFVLTKRKLLPQTELASAIPTPCFAYECETVDVQQFNIKHLSSISSSRWDWLDTKGFHSIEGCCLVLCKTIKEVIFHSDRFPMLPAARAGSVIRVLEMFPASTAWKCVFQAKGPPPPLDMVEGFLIDSYPATLKEIGFSYSTGPPQQAASVAIRNPAVLGNIRKLQVLRIPQFVIANNHATLYDWGQSAPKMLYFEDAYCILSRTDVNDPFSVTWKRSGENGGLL